MMKKTLFLLSALLLAGIGASAQTIFHECEAEFDDWSISGNSSGSFQKNTWSTEEEAAGMVTPFIEYWVGSGSVLSNATISHTQLTGLKTGYYEVSIFARAFNENSTTAVSKGITFTANSESVDLTEGTAGEYNNASEESYGVYELLVYVDGGTLNIGFTIQDLTACDWLAFKNLEVTYLGETPVGYVAHECEAYGDDWGKPAHWTADNDSSTNLHVNKHSTEADPSGMVTPFVEYWYSSGNNLPNDVLRHDQLTGLYPGNYAVSLEVRAFNESGTTAITSGTTFNAISGDNSASVDITNAGLTSSTAYNGHYELYGTLNLIATVGNDSTLDINITVSGANYNWLAFKNLKVEYDGDDMPTLECVTGTMNTTVEAAMKAAVDAYNAEKSSENYTVALAAIAAAEESVAQYAEIAALVEALDDAGKAVWETTTSASSYNAKSLTTSDDISEDMAAAQKAQTTANSDMTYVVTTGSWIAAQGNGPGTCPSLSTATETYNESSAFAEGNVLYQTITGLQPGTYTVTFYAVENSCNGVDSTTGAIAEAFANCSTSTLTVGDVSNMGNSWSGYTAWSITCFVGVDGELTFGVRNISAGGNWCVAEAVSLTLEEFTEVTTIKENIFLKNVYGGDLVSRGKQLGVAADTDFVGTPLTLYSYDGGETVVIWYADADITQTNADQDYMGSYLGGTNWASANNTLCDAVYFTMTETEYTDSEGNTATGYQFTTSDNGLLYRYDANSTPESSSSSENTYRLAVNGSKTENFSDDNQAIWVIVTTDERDAIKAAWVAEQKVAVATAAGLSDITTEEAFDNYVATLAETAIVENEISSTESGEWSGGTYTENGVESYQGYVRLTRNFTDLVPGIYKIMLNGLDRNSDPAYSKEMYNAGYTDLSESYIYANGYEINLQPWASEGYWNENTNYYYPNWMSEASAMFEDGKYLNELYTYVDEGGELSIQIAMLVTEYYGWAQVKNFSLYRLDEQIEWTMTPVGYGTLILPFEAEVPTGLQAYTATEVTEDGDGNATLNLSEKAAETIAANTPYIIVGTVEENTTYKFSGTVVDTEAEDNSPLVGTFEEITVPNNGSSYVLQQQDGTTAFYLVDSEDIICGAYHCYLSYTSTDGGNAKLVVNFPDNDIATRIEAVETEETANEAIYDLSGRRVAKAQKGIYIVNGKKMVIK